MSELNGLGPVESNFSRSWMLDTELDPVDEVGNFNPGCLEPVALPDRTKIAIARIAGKMPIGLNPYVEIEADVDDDTGVDFFIIEVEIPHEDLDALQAFEQENGPEVII